MHEGGRRLAALCGHKRRHNEPFGPSLSKPPPEPFGLSLSKRPP